MEYVRRYDLLVPFYKYPAPVVRILMQVETLFGGNYNQAKVSPLSMQWLYKVDITDTRLIQLKRLSNTTPLLSLALKRS